MGYLHINNLYKDQTILIFKECYALEKIHGTSAHIMWNGQAGLLTFFSGGEKHERFMALFDVEALTSQFIDKFPESTVIIYGEAYGGKQQGMSETYGKELKFIAFDVMINSTWLSVPNAHQVASYFNIEFVDYHKVPTDIESLNFERDKDSTQAIRNGVGPGKLREGVVLKPLVEVTTNNKERIIAKHKRDEFRETKSPRVVTGNIEVIENARSVAEEWVTEMRLSHVLDKLPGVNIEGMRQVISAMVEDVYREGAGEIKESKAVEKAISAKTALMFKDRLRRSLEQK